MTHKDYKQRFVSSSVSIILLVTLFILAPYPLFHPIFAAAVATLASMAIREFSRLLKAKHVEVNNKFLIIWTFAFTFYLLLATYFPILYQFLLIAIPLSFVALFFCSPQRPQGQLRRGGL